MISAILSATPAAWALEPNALPTGGTVAAGSGSIHASGNQMTVQQDSHRLVTNWNSFNIGSDAGVRFAQPSSSAVALARVLSNEGSQIYGTLSANGQVFLVNPNGVYFAPGASVNVGGLVASTLDISNENFLNGRNSFERLPGTADGEVLNQGRIEAADGGSVALIGATVVNDGEIFTRNGNAALAAGDQVTLDFHGDQLLMLNVDKSTLAAQVANNGLIQADGGAVVMKARAKDALMESVVNNTGIVRARSIGMKDGIVMLDGGAEGVVLHSGAIDVSGLGAGEKGGTAKVLGDKVALIGSASIDARGDAGGGTVLVGGDYKGAGEEQNATATVMGTNAVILADAVTTGDGGKVILWADDATRFHGSISARGGAQSGNGGFVETSGKEMLEAYGSVDAGAANGTAGNWLLDPRNVSIAAVTANGAFDDASPNVFTPTDDTATIDVASINTSLNGGTSVTVTTGSTGTQFGNITLEAGTAVSKTAGADATLRLEAARDVIVNGTIESTSDKLHVVLNSAVAGAAGSVSIGAGGQVITNGGNITIGGGADPATGSTLGGGVTTNGFRMQGGGTNQSTGALLSSGAGNILINAAGSTASGMTLQSAGFSTILSGSGSITINGTAGGGTSGINISTGNNTISSLSGNIALNGQGTTGNGITLSSGGTNVITSESGNITLSGTRTSGSGSDLNIAPSTGTVRIGTHTGATANHDLSYTGSSGGTISLEGDTLNLAPTTSGNVQVAGTGALVIQPRTAPTAIGIGTTPGGVNTLVLDAAKLANLADGFSSVTIGRADGTGAINVGSANFTDNLVLRGGATAFNGALNMNANNLAVQAAGAITQAAALTVGGTTSLAAGSNDITLDNAGNDFTGAVSIGSGNNVTLTDSNAVAMGASTVTGDLALNAGGQITQTGALTVGGALTADTSLAGAGDAVINNSGAAGTQLGNVQVGNDFTLTTAAGAGNITQPGGSHLEIGRHFSVTGGTLTAPSASNAIGGSDNSAGAGVVKVAQVGIVDLSTVDIGGGAGNIATTAGQSLNVQSLASGFNVTAAGAGSNAVNLGLANNIGGIVTVKTGGALPGVAASGAAVATGINQNGATINTGGAASFSTTASAANPGGAAGDITLGGAGNQFGGALSLNGNNVTVNAQGALQLGTVNADTFNLTTGGALTQTAAVVAATLNAAVGVSNDITLGNAGNNIGTLTVTSARNVTHVDTDAIVLGASAIAGDFSLTAGGAVTQTGAVTVAGNTSLSAAGQDITLTNAGNDFAGSVQAGAGNVSLTDANALTLAGANITGNLNINAGGLVTQTGALTIGGNLGVTTTHAAGNVSIDNTGAAATQLGNALIGGDFTLTATGKNVAQAAATEIDVAGNFVVNAATGTMQDVNVVGGIDNSQPGTTVIKQLGVVTLGNVNAAGNLSVSSLASAKTFAGPAIGGSAVTLTNAANNIGGQISVNTQAPAINAAGPAVATGIVQTAGTTVTAAGNAGFTATGGGINLSNAGNNFSGNLTATADNVTLANATVGGSLAINQAIGAALSNLNVGGAATVSNGGVTSLNGTFGFGSHFTIGATGTGAVALAGNTAINTAGTGAVSFGTMTGGAHDLTVQAHNVAFDGNWTGAGSYALHANTAAKSVGIGGGAGTFNLSAAEMAFIGNANASQVTIGRTDGTGTVTLAGFSFDDALRIRGGNTNINGGTYVFDGGLDLAANGNIRIAADETVNITTSNDALRLAATSSIFFNAGTATNVNTDGGAIILASRSDDSALGTVDLRNVTLASGGGNITIGGGADPSTGYATGGTVNGVRLGNTAINSSGGNVIINGQSGTSTGVGMGISSATTIDAGAGDIIVRGQSTSGAGIAMQSGTEFGGQTLTTTTGNITLAGTSATGDGMRVGSTSANTAVTLQTGGGNISLTGTNAGDSGSGSGLNIGAGTVTMQTAGAGQVTLTGSAVGTGHGVRMFSSGSTNTALTTASGDVIINGTSTDGSGVYIGPSTTLTGTTTAITTGSGNVAITGTSNTLYGVNLTASGTAEARGAANIDTNSGNIVLAGASATNLGFRNNPTSTGDTRIGTVTGSIAISGVTGGPTAVSIDPSTSSGNNGSATIAATGAGNIFITGNQIALDGSRTSINGAGGALTLQPTTAGTTIGFGSGTTGTLSFSNAQLAAIGSGFSNIYVGNSSAGAVEIGATQPLANVVAVFSGNGSAGPAAPAAPVAPVNPVTPVTPIGPSPDPVVNLPAFDPDAVKTLVARIATTGNTDLSTMPLLDLDEAEDAADVDGRALSIVAADGCARSPAGGAAKCPTKTPARAVRRGAQSNIEKGRK